MKKIIFLNVAVFATLALFTGSCKGPDAPKSPEFNPTAEQKKDKDRVLESFTTGDQTDIYTIPLDEDQLSDERLLQYFDKESKEYKEKHPSTSTTTPAQ